MHPDFLPFIRKLEGLFPLSDEEKQSLAELPLQVRGLRADQDIVREGDRPSQCCLLLEGFAYRYKLLDEGRRQIFSVHIAGDMPDLLSLHLPIMDHNLGTLTPSRVAFIPHQSLRALTRRHPRIGEAFWRDTLVDAAVFREWMVGMGRRSAYSRVAHLLCELVLRMQVVGLAQGTAVQLPLTQEMVGDALGLSAVHTNRVLQRLRGEGLITWQSKVLTVEDWDGLRRAGEFDPAYLHFDRDAVA
jgi:CRP-like cAMP-binding protein